MEATENRLAGLSPKEQLLRGLEIIDAIQKEIRKVIKGKDLDHFIALLMAAILQDDGHTLARAPVGLAKTTLLDALARAIGGEFGRIQCRPDQLPSDLTGYSQWNLKTGELEIHHGPIYGMNVFLADEINRATPKTLSALLEVMGEGHITIPISGTDRGKVFPLPPFFLVVATRNPLEEEGVWPLPAATLDRFFAQAVIKDVSDETLDLILRDEDIHRRVKVRLDRIQAVTNPQELLTLGDAIFGKNEDDEPIVFASDDIRNYIVALLRQIGDHPAVKWGRSPRGPIRLWATAKVAAFLDPAASEQIRKHGRLWVDPQHVRWGAVDILAHRIFMNPEERDYLDREFSPADIVREALDSVKYK